MARSLCPDRERATIAIAASIATLAWPSAVAQVSAIGVAGLIGWKLFPAADSTPKSHLRFPLSKKLAVGAWTVFFALLIGLPLLRQVAANPALEVFDSFFRVGSLVFGGGHVVLPLLREAIVTPGWVSDDIFLTGYGAAQAVPGPLFTFTAYLGAVMGPQPNGWAGATLCLVAGFLPSFLLVLGALPFWESLRRLPLAQAALRGVNAAVVGLLLAALYNPIWMTGITRPGDFALAAAAFLLLFMWQTPP
jgi:chromate transporter